MILFKRTKLAANNYRDLYEAGIINLGGKILSAGGR